MPVGYSGTPLPKKLGITSTTRLTVLGGPSEYRSILGEVPVGAQVSPRLTDDTNIVHLFVTQHDALSTELSRLRKALNPDATVWVSWPKKASRVPTSVTEDVIRDLAAPGLRRREGLRRHGSLVGAQTRRAQGVAWQECGLTLRSSRWAPGLGRATPWSMLLLAAKAPCLRAPLSSKVRGRVSALSPRHATNSHLRLRPGLDHGLWRANHAWPLPLHELQAPYWQRIWDLGVLRPRRRARHHR